MLILTRKSDESIWIGENICIRVAEVKDKQVNLDIQAPGAANGQANIQTTTKKLDDTISIGENISIKIVQIRGKQVRLGIDAPANLLVLRGEEKKLSERDKGSE